MKNLDKCVKCAEIGAGLSHKWAKQTSDISCSTQEIISYFQTSVYCSVYYKKNSPIAPQK